MILSLNAGVIIAVAVPLSILVDMPSGPIALVESSVRSRWKTSSGESGAFVNDWQSSAHRVGTRNC